MVEKIAKDWLRDNHESNKSSVKEIKVNGKRDNIELKGEIEFKDYVNLEVVELVGTKGLIKVIFKNCLAIKEISVYGNEITEIDGLNGLAELRELKCNDNKLTKIDVSRNSKLVVFRYHANPPLKGENIKGLGNLANIVRLTGGADASDGIALNLTLISKEELEKIAKELNISTSGKTLDDIRKLIEDQGKKGNEYDQLVKNNDPELVEVDSASQAKKISQTKINGLKSANQDAMDAIDRLGVTDLKTDTLGAKLGDGIKLSDITDPTTLKDLLDENKKLKDALSKVGLNPNDKDVEDKLEGLKNNSNKWNATEEVIKQEEGDKYFQNFEAQVLVVVNKQN